MPTEASYNHQNGNRFSNLLADSIFTYYLLVLLKAERKADRRRV